MKFGRHLEPACPEEIRRAKDRVTIRPPSLGEQIDYKLRKRNKNGNITKR